MYKNSPKIVYLVVFVKNLHQVFSNHLGVIWQLLDETLFITLIDFKIERRGKIDQNGEEQFHSKMVAINDLGLYGFT